MVEKKKAEKKKKVEKNHGGQTGGKRIGEETEALADLNQNKEKK